MPYATRSIIPDAFYLCMIYTLFEDSENMHLALLFEGGNPSKQVLISNRMALNRTGLDPSPK